MDAFDGCEHDPGAYIVAAVVFRELHGIEGPAGGWIYCPECDRHCTWSVSWEGFDVASVKADIPSWAEFVADYRGDIAPGLVID